MILQVHDELVLEVPQPELERAIPRGRDHGGAYPLRRAVKVDAKVGKNWLEMSTV
jgi:DNA polymerase I